jgi:bifunctional DNase/RNase
MVDVGPDEVQAPADDLASPQSAVEVDEELTGESLEEAGAEQPEPEIPAPVFRVMDVMDVSLELPSQYPQVTLQEAEPPLRHLVFPIGLHEATGLAHALHKVATPRPLSHELFADVLLHFHIDLVAVRLVGRRAGTYLAEVDLIGARGREVIACRPTDALTLALRMPVPAPVLCDQRLLESDGDVEPG